MTVRLEVPIEVSLPFVVEGLVEAAYGLLNASDPDGALLAASRLRVRADAALDVSGPAIRRALGGEEDEDPELTEEQRARRRQQRRALGKANSRRMAGSALRKSVASVGLPRHPGESSWDRRVRQLNLVLAAIAAPAEHEGATSVLGLITDIRHVTRVNARRLLASVHVSSSERLDGLSPRQRSDLAAALGELVLAIGADTRNGNHPKEKSL
jgi:hypothetical protein